MQPDITVSRGDFEAALKRILRRMWLGHFIYAVAAGVAMSAVLGAFTPARRANILGAVAACVMSYGLSWRRTRARAAASLERLSPGSRNTIVTAEELLRHPERASDRMAAHVLSRAAQLAAAAPPGGAYRVWVPVGVLAVTLAAALAVPSRTTRSAPIADAIRSAVGLPPGVPRLSVAIEPPAYARLRRVEVVDPERIDAIEGSTVHLAIGRDAAQWRLRFGDRAVPWDANGAATLTLNESAYFALEPASGTDAAGRLIPVTVTPDRAPVVTIDTPARDLVVPDASREIPVTVTAADDLALESLELRYTKVSGTGEDFEFVEGTLPIALARANDRDWKGRATIGLTALQLEPGDSLVYRAVAKDRRPEGEASSDTFFVEVAGPGQVALEGFELPPDQERYALSQQMIVLKIERLRAREQAMDSGAVKEATGAIAAEQRAVRANFIFLMGGHVEDEEVEAEQSSEIQEGRLENSARREISTAVHLMTRVEQGLMASSTATALPPAKLAVEALQRAFGRNRYILRTPPSRSEIDPSRRLSGALSAADPWRRDPIRPERDPKHARLDAFVAAALAVATRLQSGEDVDRRAFTALAERALAIDPAAREWQQAAARLTEVARRAEGGTPSGRLAALNQAVKPALDAARAASRPAAPGAVARPNALERAWSGERRR